MRNRPPIELSAGRVTVRFQWSEDRYRHDIVVADEVVAHSVEGDGLNTSPPSPPLQDLSLEQLAPDVLAIMGVGGAGRGHWSISVTRVENQGLLFELACRGDIESLGSQYNMLGDVRFDPQPTATLDDDVIRPVERLVGTNVWAYVVR